MSWRVILSEYPQSLFKDESAIAILAMIESEGLAKEEDVREHFDVAPSDFAKALLHLQQNSLISYSRAYVQITERGRAILDRFNLGSEISQQALKKLQLPRTDEQLIAEWVAKYRAESLDEYLFTLKTARSWAHLASVFHFAEHAADHVAAAGSAAIWLDDLRSWLSIRHRPDESDQQYRIILLLDNIDQLPDGTVVQHLSDARAYLRTFRKLSADALTWETLGNEHPEHAVFTCHHYSRTRLIPTLWAAEWENNSECLGLLSTAKSYTKLLSNLRSHALQHWNTTSEETMPARRYRSSLDTLIRRNVGDLLLAVLSADSLDDLEKSTHIARQPLVKLLSEIHEKVSEILAQSGNSATEDSLKDHQE